MEIILIGNGKTGSAIMRQLVADGHTVTVVDIQESALARSADEYDIMTVSGNGVTAEVLEQAGVRQADLLISFTNSDEVNLLCCLAARKLNPDLHTIPRVREPEYLRLATDLREEFGISMVVNPDGDAARDGRQGRARRGGGVRREDRQRALVNIQRRWHQDPNRRGTLLLL